MSRKARAAISISLYLLGIILFIFSNASLVSGSSLHLVYGHRILLCSAAVISLATAPFVWKTTTSARTITKFFVAALLICCIFIFGGFADNAISCVSRLLG